MIWLGEKNKKKGKGGWIITIDLQPEETKIYDEIMKTLDEIYESKQFGMFV